MDGIFGIPWFVENQASFNIWIGTANDAEAKPKGSGKCKRKKPSRYSRDYGWADAIGVVHRSGEFACRDAAAFRFFSVEHDTRRLQVTAHELGHALFYLSDEYCTDTTSSGKCKGGRFTSIPVASGGFAPPFPNLYPDEVRCRAEATRDGYDPDLCRELDAAQIGPPFWLREPDYRRPDDPSLEVPDLMQQTGERVLQLPGGGTRRVDQYGVGNSESERMDWVVGNCAAGDC